MKPAPIDPPEIWHTLWDRFHGAVGWDIGANCGQTLPVQLERFQHVHAFEPAAECMPYLNNFASDRCTIHPYALSDNDDGVELMAIPEKIDTGQLVTAGVNGMEWHVDMSTAQPREVPCYTVDSLVEGEPGIAPDFMKIDVEGHEKHVLFGARKTLARYRPDLLIEFHSPELRAACTVLLEMYGYDVETVRHPHYPPDSEFWHQHGWLLTQQKV